MGVEPKSKLKLRGGGRGSAGKKSVSHKKDTTPIKAEDLTGWKARLLLVINEQGTNPRQVSISSGLSPSTIRQALYTTRSMGVETLTAICKTLAIDMHWLVTGEGESRATAEDQGFQRVPVIAWGNVPRFIDKKGECEAMRTEVAERIEPSQKRFRLDVTGQSMAPVINDGDTIDCSGALVAEPEDIVVVWSAQQRQFLVRRVKPMEFGPRGAIKAAMLMAENKAWPELIFRADEGDRILAVVFDVIHPIKRLRRR